METKKITITTKFKIPPFLHSEIEKLATKEGINIEEMIIKMLTNFLKENSPSSEEFLPPVAINGKSSNLRNAPL